MSAPASAAVHADGALSKQRLRVWLRVLKLARGIETDLRERLRREHQITLPRFDVLAALDRCGAQGLTMSELSAALRVSNGNATVVVERLVADGLVVREAVAGDRRATRVRLTDQGLRRFAELAAAHEGWLDELLAGVDASAAAELIALLDDAVAPIKRRNR